MSESVVPEWRKAWKVDDLGWMEDRLAQWSDIKHSSVFKNFYDKEYMEDIKNFFLYGRAHHPEPPEEDWRWLTYHPRKRPLAVSDSPLLQLWLCVDLSDSLKSDLRKFNKPRSLARVRWFFRDKLRHYYPDQGSLFNGRDNIIYHFFGPTRCRPEDYPEFDGKAFQEIAGNVRLELHPLIDKYIHLEYNKDSLAPDALDEWCDSLVPAVLSKVGIDTHLKLDEEITRKIYKTLAQAFKILGDESEFAEEQVTFARRMVDRFKQMEFPEVMASLRRLLEESQEHC